MLSPQGKVRHLILSEQGFTSDSPERGGQVLELQAQCIAEAYQGKREESCDADKVVCEVYTAMHEIEPVLGDLQFDLDVIPECLYDL